MQAQAQLATMTAAQLREFAASLLDQVARLDGEVRLKQLKIDQLTHEMSILNRITSYNVCYTKLLRTSRA